MDFTIVIRNGRSIMFAISYFQMVLGISLIWIFIRTLCALRAGKICICRELQLLLVYICIVVVVRFTFCPFGKVDGRIQPLLFDRSKIFPLWLNLKPFIYLFDYPTMKEALLNLIGNTTMFIPLGIVWPAVFKELNTHAKALAAGFGVSLSIEILQLPFYGRASDIDDLILNTAGYLVGYLIFLAFRAVRRKIASPHKP